MELVVVERTFSESVDFEAIEAMEARVGWCLEQHRVRFLRSYLSNDGRRMLCLYEAPDAESVREVNRIGGLPFDSVWTATVCGAEPTDG